MSSTLSPAMGLFIPEATYGDSYQSRLSKEVRRYEACLKVHDLPAIFHYWSNRHILPKLLPFGFSSPDEMFAKYLAEQCAAGSERPKRFVSLGCGNCDLETGLALDLRARGHSGFILDCVDVNPAMLERGRISAAAMGVADCMSFIQADLNNWTPATEYDGALANQSLHHVVNLEQLSRHVSESLRPQGCFVISDMIGRNGHQRWPEALAVIHEFWRNLPPSYRFNRKSGCYEDLYLSHDCSAEEFEGVRSQDILPVLLENFQFQLFIPFGNAIDPFVDRAFGPNFDPAIRWDRDFIEAVHARDEAEIFSGRIKPTHMLAVVGSKAGRVPQFDGHPAPESCVRLADRASQSRDIRAASPVPPALDTSRSGPHGIDRELEIAVRRLAESSDRIKRQEALSEEDSAAFIALKDEFERRTIWARSLDEQLSARTVWARSLEADAERRTAWARDLERELDLRTVWARGLEAELEARTAWAHTLEKELEEYMAWTALLQQALDEQSRLALRLEHEVAGYVHNPLRLVRKVGGRFVNRLRRVFRSVRMK